MSKHIKATDALVGVVEAQRDKLTTHMLPSPEIVREAISGCINSRNGQWRRTAPAADIPRALWDCVKFHGGNGCGVEAWMVSRWSLRDDELFETLDTLAIVLLECKSSAASAWERALCR